MTFRPSTEFGAAGDAGSWMASEGPDHDVILSSRIRLARNVQGFPFRSKLQEAQSRELEGFLCSRLEKLQFAGDQVYLGLEELETLERELLLERHLISVELARGDGPRGVLFSRDRHLSVMVNEEDHVRLQRMAPGPHLPELLADVRELDAELSELLDYSVHHRFGFLTSCPTNVGTGMRLSVMLHLPALVYSKEIEKEFNAAQKMKLAVRGFYGEGTAFLGDFFQVSNQVTLGKSTEQLLNDLLKVIPNIVEHEREVRRLMMEKQVVELEDRVFRAYGLLENARKITSTEALEQLSQVRLGVCMGMIENLDLAAINEMLVMTQPAHIQLVERRPLDEQERDVVRARYLRERIARASGS